MSLFVYLEMSRVLFATEGKDASTLVRCKTDLEVHHGNSSYIRENCCGMSPAFIKGVENYFPEAHLTFDNFHVLKILNEVVDDVQWIRANHPPVISLASKRKQDVPDGSV